MFRCILPVIRSIKPASIAAIKTVRLPQKCNLRALSSLNPNVQTSQKIKCNQSLLCNNQILNIGNNINHNNMQVRSVTKFSLKKGKRKTVKIVPVKFFRLHWGGWIRTKCGRNKKIWKKSSARRRILRQHVFCNATQSTLLDKMVTKYWKRPKHYIDDPYTPYHTREEFEITRKKPIVRD